MKINIYKVASSIVLLFGLVISLFSQVPPNDNCIDAVQLTCDVPVMGSNFGGSNNGPACAGGADGSQGGVWYTFAGNGQNVTVILDADPTGLTTDLADSQIAVYSGSCGNLTCIGGNDDATPPGGNGSAFTFTSVIGTDYYFYANGFLSLAGDFEIGVECFCAPPSATASVDLTNCTVNGTFDILVNLTSIGSSQAVNITHNGTSPDSYSSVGVGMYLLSGFTTGGSFTVTIADDVTGTCMTTVSVQNAGCPPVNDLCTNAIPAQIFPIGNGCNNFTPTTNIGATDSGELPVPSCGFYSGGDTWFSINIPSDGQLIITYPPGNFSSLVSTIYTGTCGALTEVACTINFFNSTETVTGLPPGPALFRVWDFQNDEIGIAAFCLEGNVPSCPADFVGPNALSGLSTIDGITDYETTGGIESVQTIDINTDYDSGMFVELNAGFEVLMNNVFDALIDTANCNGGAGGNQ